MVNKIQIFEWFFYVVWIHEGDKPEILALCFSKWHAENIAYYLSRQDEYYKVLLSYRGHTRKFK